MSITPLVLLKNKFPEEIIRHIQLYMLNDLAYQVVNSYFDYLYEKKELCDIFAYSTYVLPQCFCHRYRNCSACWEYESGYYWPNDFKVCILDNDQYDKIQWWNYHSKNKNDAFITES